MDPLGLYVSLIGVPWRDLEGADGLGVSRVCWVPCAQYSIRLGLKGVPGTFRQKCVYCRST